MLNRDFYKLCLYQSADIIARSGDRNFLNEEQPK